MRLAQSTTAELTELSLAGGRRSTKIDYFVGHRNSGGQNNGGESFRVVTPDLEVEVSNGSSFRVDATDGNSWVTALAGNLQITAAGSTNPLSAGSMLHLSADGQSDVEGSPAADDFDSWSLDRDRMISSQYASAAPYVGADDEEYYNGAADLSAYGYWGNFAGCGACWIPSGVSNQWMPFGIGSWCYYGNLGWTWISAEPWGWLPYHYGRWFYTTRGWAWSPNPVRRWNPGAVEWIKADGKTAWVPRGTPANSRRPDGAAGYVTGTETANGMIRSERGTGMPHPPNVSSFPIIISARPPIPSAPKNDSTRGAKTIVYDPGTKTYVNGESRRFEPRGTPRTDPRKSDAPRSERPIAVRPQLGPPSGYAQSAQPTNAPSWTSGEPSRPVRGTTGSTNSGGRPENGPANNSAPSQWRSAAPPQQGSVPSQTVPHNSAPAPRASAPAPTQHAPAPAPTPHASAPAPTPHASAPTPHH